MTILPVKTHNQKKEDVTQRPDNVNRDQRSNRQRHFQRDRTSRIHSNEQQINSANDFPFWNVGYGAAASTDIPPYNAIASHSQPVADIPHVQAIVHPQIPQTLPEAASTSSEVDWRISSQIEQPETSCEKATDSTSKTSKKEKKVCAKRRQRRTSPYSKVRQKYARNVGHSLKSENPFTPANIVPSVSSARANSNAVAGLGTSSNNNVIKSEITNFNSENDLLNKSSPQAQLKSKGASGTGHPRPATSYPTTNEDKASTSQNKDGYESGESDGKNNSDDEYDPNRLRRLHKNVNFEEIERKFEQKMKEKRGFIIRPMVEDGACLFRAVSDQVYGDQNMHDVVRKNCMDYMLKNADFFKHYVTEDFSSYILRKRKTHTHGNHLEIHAMAELYNRPFEVYQYSVEPINTFQSSSTTENVPVRLSYHQNSHYNSVVDPYKATVGVGLGLPSFKPGSADENLLKSAQCASERQLLEEQMFNDKAQATDWESTEEAVLKHVAMQSYKQYVEQSTSSTKDSKTSAQSSSVTKEKPTTEESPPVEKEIISKPSSSTAAESKTPKSSNDTPASSCVSDWVDEEEEWQVLSRVMAASQQEYIDSFKQSKPTCSKYT